MNAFDGVLTALGVLVGGYLGGVDSPRAIFVVVLTTAVGMGVSGFYGSYLVERAERDRAMRELEESTLSSLQDTTIASASRYATIVIAFVDGASPFAAALIVMIPFLFTGMLGMHGAYYAAVVVALVELFLLGRLPRRRLARAPLALRAAPHVRRRHRAGHQPAARRGGGRACMTATTSGPPACSPASTSRSARPSRTSRARCSSSPAPAPARRACSRTASPTSSRRTACSRTRSWPSPSPTRPPAR